MRVYYLAPERWARVILRDFRFKLATLPELNDPFEFLGGSLGERTSRLVANTLHRHWSRSIGLLCTSTTWQSPVMWAHYGDRHRGVCLGFDISEDVDVHEVVYEPTRLKGLFENFINEGAITADQVMQILTTKYSEWSYEREKRVFARLDQREADGLYYLDFSPHFKLRQVIVGAKCNAPLCDFAALVRKDDSDVEIFKARPAFGSFQIVRQKNVRPIVIRA